MPYQNNFNQPPYFQNPAQQYPYPASSAQTPAYPIPQITGRLIRSIDEVTPQEVPMNGSPGVFPLQDMSAIFVKAWTKEGNIATVRFVPETPEEKTAPTNLEARLDAFDKRFDKLERMLSKKPYKPMRKENRNEQPYADRNEHASE